MEGAISIHGVEREDAVGEAVRQCIHVGPVDKFQNSRVLGQNSEYVADFAPCEILFPRLSRIRDKVKPAVGTCVDKDSAGPSVDVA